MGCLIVDANRKLKQDLYVRVCKDYGWQIDYIEAAKLVSRILKCNPFDVYDVFGDFDTMHKISKGEHLICDKGNLT